MRFKPFIKGLILRSLYYTENIRNLQVAFTSLNRT